MTALVKLGKMFLNSPQKLFSFLRKLNLKIFDFQISWHHQMPQHKTRIMLIFYYQKELSKLTELFFFLVSQELSFRHTKKTSKNVADTISRHNYSYIKIMWFINFSTKHPICKIFLCLNRCLVKIKTKTLQVCLSQFYDQNINTPHKKIYSLKAIVTETTSMEM